MKYYIHKRPGLGYTLLRGAAWPQGAIVSVPLTLRGARWKARRDAKRGPSSSRPLVEVLDL